MCCREMCLVLNTSHSLLEYIKDEERYNSLSWQKDHSYLFCLSFSMVLHFASQYRFIHSVPYHKMAFIWSHAGNDLLEDSLYSLCCYFGCSLLAHSESYRNFRYIKINMCKRNFLWSLFLFSFTTFESFWCLDYLKTLIFLSSFTLLPLIFLLSYLIIPFLSFPFFLVN
jgi:hypothetical protein